MMTTHAELIELEADEGAESGQEDQAEVDCHVTVAGDAVEDHGVGAGEVERQNTVLGLHGDERALPAAAAATGLK